MQKKISIKDRIVNYVYSVSSQPVSLRDLLSANSYYNEKMYVDPGKLGFRIKITRAYTVYLIFVLIVLAPLTLVAHYPLTNMNFHFSIIGTVFVTSSVFIGFTFFKAWIRDAITLRLIKKAWLVHFPYFSYDKYSKKAASIYNQVVKNEIPKKDLRLYVMDKLVEDN